MNESQPRGIPLHTKILIGLLLGAIAGVAVNVAFITPLERDKQRQVAAAQVASASVWMTQLPLSPLPVVPFSAEMNQPSLTLAPAQPVPFFRWLLTNVMDPVGRIFLNLLLMTVVPLVFASLALGVAQLGDLRSLGRVGAKALTYFVITTALAVVIGLVLVNAVKPGEGLPEETKVQLMATYKGKAEETKPGSIGVDLFVNIVPRNPFKAAVEMDMLAVIFVAVLVGIGLTHIPQERAKPVLAVIEGLGDLMTFIIGVAMRLAPYGVFALIFSVTARFGFSLIQALGWYIGVVLVGLAIHFFGVFSILVRVFSGLSPLWFFKKVRNVVLTAFSTSSSNATLPTSIKTAEEELGVPPKIAGFVLPLGATMNMNGTALFEGVTVLFLAQVFGVPLDFGQQCLVVLLAVLTAIGAAGVPGGSIPLLMMVLVTVGVPGSGIALILGVDRLLDMCRTTLNVVGDITCATFITRSEGYELAPQEKSD